ncbi:hypothetical protein SRB5_58490 [Streptomyces sp. RB5]|uniref:Histidine kinase/HSP90-like ATPase domain-containing protein n=2 Tax=Streptomyces smaragdinus TaxID=2585196 RepID=A0A7K0CQI5_9ACTN|nr:hypothetical protein [Streptomyces smaragdinus]
MDYRIPTAAPARVDDVLLITSELVTNAVRYGGEPGDSLTVALVPLTGTVRVEVHDTVRRRPRLRPESAERQRGRGLWIVETLANQWGMDDRPLGKLVWAVVTV